jgi:PTH2 family peptidyl-tRNA hydrolase
LKGRNEEELLQLWETAKQKGLIVSRVYDAGFTQVAPNTLTVLGIGPALDGEIDLIVSHLRLL